MSRTSKRETPKFADDVWQGNDDSARDSYWDRAFAIAEREANYGASARTARLPRPETGASLRG